MAVLPFAVEGQSRPDARCRPEPERLASLSMCRLAAIVLLFLVVLGCGPSHKVSKTKLDLFRFERDGSGLLLFRGCTVYLGWSKSQLLQRCGQPVRIVRNARAPAHECFVYETEAAPFVGAQEASAGVVCFGKPKPPRRSGENWKRARDRAAKAEPRVLVVYSLRDLDIPPLPPRRPSSPADAEQSPSDLLPPAPQEPAEPLSGPEDQG